jgi:hypothetical protein
VLPLVPSDCYVFGDAWQPHEMRQLHGKASARECYDACEADSNCNYWKYMPQWGGLCELQSDNGGLGWPVHSDGNTDFVCGSAPPYCGDAAHGEAAHKPTGAPTFLTPTHAATPEQSCWSQWDAMACTSSACYTCGSRIDWLVRHSRSGAQARAQVADEFTKECAACREVESCLWKKMACAGTTCSTCGSRIDSLVRHGQSGLHARTQVVDEFPEACAACSEVESTPTLPTPANCFVLGDAWRPVEKQTLNFDTVRECFDACVADSSCKYWKAMPQWGGMCELQRDNGGLGWPIQGDGNEFITCGTVPPYCDGDVAPPATSITLVTSPSSPSYSRAGTVPAVSSKVEVTTEKHSKYQDEVPYVVMALTITFCLLCSLARLRSVRCLKNERLSQLQSNNCVLEGQPVKGSDVQPAVFGLPDIVIHTHADPELEKGSTTQQLSPNGTRSQSRLLSRWWEASSSTRSWRNGS